ncbi:MAG: UbiD family decarboxylase [Rhodospirillales bacterium]|jgi:UbiD family decarboxylase|nr:carboxylyase [Rhodospirillaceae bacterium]MDP6430322.1 UbiD family decarboxylase [Rhodospirillales bacterium]MDP6646402.1 UbiD family decarboxylase [Rhodospirillales bacterium]MDP6841541.1 UbiD family decarboxylase [Rhodospirillales bacterium]|tara:strand:- start:1453 stop:3114 length:1662 start_codon:yes stop_codon:yes gene_type:complete
MPDDNPTKSSGNGKSAFDPDKFRLRRFVEHLQEIDELEVHGEAVPLSGLSALIEAADKAILFQNAGPEGHQLVANVSGSRSRLAAALGVPEDGATAELQRRLDNPQPVFYVEPEEAPVREIELTGSDIDLTKLPFHPQHAFDGSTYISAALDFCIDPETGITNVGARRLSLRNKTQTGTNVTAPSDLQRIYRAAVGRGEKLPISFAVGSHPVDHLAAGMRIPTDEVKLVGTLRGEPLPLVKSLSNDIGVPADAEMIIEGYLDERGYVEPEGPYGEYVGFYGAMHMDPVFHVTAITQRRDALHQSMLHGAGRVLRRMESAQLLGLRNETAIFKLLREAGFQVTQVYVPPASAEGQHVRVAFDQLRPGQARNVISLIMARVYAAKHVYVTDSDIDIRDQHDMEWAMASRFQADRDFMVFTGMMGMPMDPSLESGLIGAKAGFDMTMPMSRGGQLMATVAEAPKIDAPARHQTVSQALEQGPMFFTDVMSALGSRDGREVALALDELRQQGRLMRNGDGQYLLGEAEPGTTGLTEDALHHISMDPNAKLHALSKTK